MTTSNPLDRFDDRVASERRVRLFVLLQFFSLALILTLLLIFGLPHERQAGLIIVSIISLVALCTYVFRRTIYGELLVYANLCITVILIGVSGPLSGRIDGTAWPLFVIPPLIATIVINKPRATITVVIMSALSLVVSVTVELMQLVPVELVVPAGSLLVGMSNVLLVLTVLAVTIKVLVDRANIALHHARDSQKQLEQQLARERDQAIEQERINQELSASLNAIQERDQQLAAEAVEQGRLRNLLSQVSTPVIPVLKGVVIMPLVGIIEGTRAQELTSMLLEGVERYQAHIAIMDVTGLSSLDTQVAQALIRAAEGCKLLGTTPILAGVSPEAAQMLVALNIELSSVITVADLQSGVAYALKRHMD